MTSSNNQMNMALDSLVQCCAIQLEDKSTWFKDLQGLLHSSGYKAVVLSKDFLPWFDLAYTCEYTKVHQPQLYTMFRKSLISSPESWYEPVTLTTFLETMASEVRRSQFCRIFVKPVGERPVLMEVVHVSY